MRRDPVGARRYFVNKLLFARRAGWDAALWVGELPEPLSNTVGDWCCSSKVGEALRRERASLETACNATVGPLPPLPPRPRGRGEGRFPPRNRAEGRRLASSGGLGAENRTARAGNGSRIGRSFYEGDNSTINSNHHNKMAAASLLLKDASDVFYLDLDSYAKPRHFDALKKGADLVRAAPYDVRLNEIHEAGRPGLAGRGLRRVREPTARHPFWLAGGMRWSVRREDISPTNRGDAVADISRRRGTPRPRRGYSSDESRRRRRGYSAETRNAAAATRIFLRRIAATASRIFRGDEERRGRDADIHAETSARQRFPPTHPRTIHVAARGGAATRPRRRHCLRYVRGTEFGERFVASWLEHRCGFKDQYALWHTLLTLASDAGAVEYGGELGRSEYRYAKNAAVKPERLDLPKTLLVDGASVRSKTTRFPVLLDAARNGALLGEFTHVSTSCAETASLGPGFATTVEGTTLLVLASRRLSRGRRWRSDAAKPVVVSPSGSAQVLGARRGPPVRWRSRT